MNLPAFASFLDRSSKIAVVGLGYVGLPLAVHLSAHFAVTGYDIRKSRIAELKQGHDRTLEVSGETLKKAVLDFTADPQILSS